MAERVTTRDVLEAIREQGNLLNAIQQQSNLHTTRYDTISRQIAELAVGQTSMERRLGNVETDMQKIQLCVNEHASALAVIRDKCPHQDERIEKLEDREREGTAKQSVLTSVVSFLTSLVTGYWMNK